MAKKTTAFYDLDATLVNTLPTLRYSSLGGVLKEMELISTSNLEEMSSYEKDLIDRIWFEGSRDQILIDELGVKDPGVFWDAFQKYDLPELRLQHTFVYEDTLVVQELYEGGISQAIITGAPSRIAILEVTMVGNHLFNKVVSANKKEGVRQKPHPEGLEICLEALGVTISEVVMIGNGDEDIQAALSIGMDAAYIQRPDNKPVNNKYGVPVFNSLYEF